MNHLDEYQNLLKATLETLKSFDEKFVESRSDFFKNDLLNFFNKKKSNQNILLEKKKYNVDVKTSEISLDKEKKRD